MKLNRNLVFCLSLVSTLIAAMMVLMFRVAPKSDFSYSRLYFAAGVLGFIGFIFMLGMLLYIFDDSSNGRGKDIFDGCVKILPPIITLIVGFYFGTTQSSPEEKLSTTNQSAQKK